jgi:hypothetical protein
MYPAKIGGENLQEGAKSWKGLIDKIAETTLTRKKMSREEAGKFAEVAGDNYKRGFRLEKWKEV